MFQIDKKGFQGPSSPHFLNEDFLAALFGSHHHTVSLCFSVLGTIKKLALDGGHSARPRSFILKDMTRIAIAAFLFSGFLLSLPFAVDYGQPSIVLF